MRLSSALSSLLFLAGATTIATATDTCLAFKENGDCYDPEHFYVSGEAINATREMVAESGDATTTAVYKEFVEPMIELATELGLYDLRVESFCYGSFDGQDLLGEDKLEELGCDDLPLKEGVQYGAVAGEIPIPPSLQQALVWSQVHSDAVTPKFCMALRIPTATCSKLTFGTTLNNDAITALKETVSTGGVGESILAMMTALQGADPVSLALTFGGGLDVPVRYFTDRKFVNEDFHAHLSFNMQDKAPIGLPFVKDVDPTSVIKVDGPYQRAFHLGESTAAVEAALGTLFDPNKMAFGTANDVVRIHEAALGTLVDPTAKDVIRTHIQSVVGAYPEVISTESNVVVDLAELTQGLFQGFTLSNTDINALKLPAKVGSVHAGFYMYAIVEMDELKGIVQSVCDQFEGVLLAVAGTGCPNLDNDNEEGKLGLEIREETLELLIEWPEFFLRCKVHSMEAEHPKMDCQINDLIFGIACVSTDGKKGYAIGKSHALTGAIEEQVSVISDDAVKAAKGFGKAVVVTSRLSSKVAPKAFEHVAKFFGGEASEGRDTAMLGFHKNHECKEGFFTTTHRLWSSREKSTYSHHYSQAGNDSTRASCLQSCYEYHLDNSNYKAEDLCCSFEEFDGYDECRVAHKGEHASTDERKSATATFVADYEKLRDLPVVGTKCEIDEECFSGYCHNHICKLECSPENRCFPSDWSKCFGRDDACLNVNGANIKCDRDTDSCKCDSAASCTRNPHSETTILLMKATKDDKTTVSERRR